ncbi:MAG: hypothetical protein IPJ20_05445 [Flammeovirgaceae bacterium]|nr:hypothetical protein [Flammeovirgaceae bacterium]
MNKIQDPLEHIHHLLESKSTAKQITYKNLLAAFSILNKESKRIVNELKKKPGSADEDVTVDFDQINEHEFQVKLAGDLLSFVLHTNVVTFDDEHTVMKTAYVHENEVNRYFGQIMIYNFMSDSVKFNRVNDPGYLIARILINHENRFLVEGDGQLGQLFNNITEKMISEEDLNSIVKLSLAAAIENDLMAPPFPQVRFITLYQKMEKTQELGAGQKIGFRMQYNSKKAG